MLFSIITPCFNCAETIRQTFDSVLQQEFNDYEYIVVDGASTDGTVEIIKEYEPKFEGRMRWISEPDHGIYDAVRKGFALAYGEIFAWIGSDDVYFSNAFRNVADIFSRWPQIQWLTGERCHIDVQGTLLNAEPAIQWHYRDFYLKKAFFVQQESTFWRRELWNTCGDSFKQYRYAGDYALWLNFSKHTQLFTVPLLLAAFRLRCGQVSLSHLSDYFAEVDQICAEENTRMTRKQRFLFQLYVLTHGRRFLRRIAHKLERFWDQGEYHIVFNYDTRVLDLQ